MNIKLLALVFAVITTANFTCYAKKEKSPVLKLAFHSIHYKNGETVLTNEPIDENDISSGAIESITPMELGFNVESVMKDGTAYLMLKPVQKNKKKKLSKLQQVKKVAKILRPTKEHRQKLNSAVKQVAKSIKSGKVLTPDQMYLILRYMAPKLKSITFAAHKGGVGAILPTLKSANSGAKAGAFIGSAAGTFIGSVEPGFGNLLGSGIGSAAGILIGSAILGGITFAVIMSQSVIQATADAFLG